MTPMTSIGPLGMRTFCHYCVQRCERRHVSREKNPRRISTDVLSEKNSFRPQEIEESPGLYDYFERRRSRAKPGQVGDSSYPLFIRSLAHWHAWRNPITGRWIMNRKQLLRNLIAVVSRPRPDSRVHGDSRGGDLVLRRIRQRDCGAGIRQDSGIVS